MRIGVDVREFKKGTYTGLRTILFHFLDNVDKFSRDNDFVFFGNQQTEFSTIPHPGKKVCIRQRNTFIWDQIKLPVNLNKEKIDLFFSPYIKTPFYRSCLYVNTVCDIIPLMISKYEGLLSILEKAHFFLYSYISSRRCTLTITLSEDAKNRICKTFFLDPEKVRVVYPSVSDIEETEQLLEKTRELSNKHRLDEPFILYVGNFKKHKNVLRIINSFSFLPVDIAGSHRMILLGGTEAQCREVKAFIDEKKLGNRVFVIPNISHDEAGVFIKKASLFVFPSLAEGFGIPPVEAMKAGVAVASSNLPPMTEVLRDAAVYFDPYDPEDIADKISRLLGDQSLLGHYARLGKERARTFSPDLMSESLLRDLEFAASGKLLCLSSEYPPVTGGISTQLFNLWNNLPAEKTLILTSKPGIEGGNIGSNVMVLRRKYPLGSDLVSRILRTVFVVSAALSESVFWNVKCVHCAQVLSSGIAGLLLKRVKGVPYIVYIYSADILEFSQNAVTKWFVNKILRGSKAIIANSLFTKSLIIDKVKDVADKIVISTPVIDHTKFDMDATSEEARVKLGLPLDKKILLTVARLSKRKGHEKMIETVKEMIGEGHAVLYLIVGDGPLLEKLKVKVKENFLTEHVKFCGKVGQNELKYYYKACDVFCMVPKYMEKEGDSEGFGIVFLEASACAVPIVAGSSGGVGEAVIGEKTGILVDPDSIEEIKNAILRLLNDADLACRLGRYGKKRVEREFDIKSRVKELIDIGSG